MRKKCHFDTRIFKTFPTLPPFRALPPPPPRWKYHGYATDTQNQNYTQTEIKLYINSKSTSTKDHVLLQQEAEILSFSTTLIPTFQGSQTELPNDSNTFSNAGIDPQCAPPPPPPPPKKKRKHTLVQSPLIVAYHCTIVCYMYRVSV